MGVIEEVVAPVLHEYVAPPDAVSRAVCPEQIIAPVALAVGGPETTTVIEVVLVHEAFEVVTV